MNIFRKLETVAYKNIIVPLQGDETFDFVKEHYNRGMKVLDFGCGTGSNSKLFHYNDYIGSEIDSSRLKSSKQKYPKYKFEQIPKIQSRNDLLPWKDNTFDIIFISLCLHHINVKSCKLIFKEFRRVLKNNGKILGIEPTIISGSYFSNIFMNVLDAGDYILTQNNYTNIYLSESFKTKHINLVKTFGYNLWQYSSTINGDKSIDFKTNKTTIRRITKPIHLLGLYGKWPILVFIFYSIIKILINIINSF